MKYRLYAPLLAIGLCFLSLSWISRNLCAQVSEISISEIRFEGNHGISTLRLKSLLRRSQEGNRYLEKSLSMDLMRLREAYLDEGFLHVDVGSPDIQIQELGEEKTAVVTIPIVEGPRYRVGEMYVAKTRVLPSATLLQMCPLTKGAPYSPIKTARWRLMIEDTYRSLGHIRARCSLLEEIDEAGKTVDGTLKCEEGQPYRIGKITLVGDESIDVSRLKRSLLLREGGVYNPEMLAMSIQYLNRSGVYKPISSSDVQTAIHDEDRTVDITFHLFSAEEQFREYFHNED